MVAAPPDFDEFSPASHADWLVAARALLPNSASLESLATDTLEGLRLQPLYSAEHSAHIQHQHALPGGAPGLGGGSTQARPWLIVQASRQANARVANQELRVDIANGGTAIALLPDDATLLCLDPDKAAAGLVGQGGSSLADAGDLAAALDGIALDSVPLLLQCGSRSLPLPALLMAALRRRSEDLGALRGAVGADPLAWLATNGSLPVALEALYGEQAAWTRWCLQHAPGLDTIFLDGAVWHEAGANSVQELACSLANGAASVREICARGLSVDAVASRMSLGLALGSDFLMELAKLRAARLLWSQMIEAFGGSAASQGLTLHARTSRRNRSALDPWSNMLRSSQEALLGVIGGCDSLLIEPFDAPLRPASEFSRRHARNQQLILQHEVGLARLQDPASGSWTIEVLTDWLAREAWAAFQQIEACGGLLAALRDGSIQREIGAVAQQRAQRNARRKDVQVGSNQFADTIDFASDAQAGSPNGSSSGRAAQFASHARSDLPALAAADASTQTFAALLEAAERGATLAQLADALAQDDGEMGSVLPLHSQRHAAPWEVLRGSAAAHRQQGGTLARVYLATLGEAAALHARASFVSDFFAVGGFACVDDGALTHAEDAAEAAIASGAPAVVICALDAKYPEVVPPFCKRIRERCPEMIVYLAGRPREAQEQELRAAGIDDFVHLGADCLKLNQTLQQRTGIAP